MKKAVLFLSLTYVVAVLCANYLTLSSPLSATSKATILIWFDFASLSAALLVRLVWQATCSTTGKQGGSSQPKALSPKEQEVVRIAGRVTKNHKGTTDSEWLDEWEDLNEQDRKNRNKLSECNISADESTVASAAIAHN